MGRRVGIDGRELLLAAGLRLFSEQGIDAVSIRAVNREAGLGPASIHYHFGTKDALIEAVLHLHGDHVAAAIAEQARQVARKDVVTAHDLVLMLAQPYLDLIAGQSESGRDWIRVAS